MLRKIILAILGHQEERRLVVDLIGWQRVKNQEVLHSALLAGEDVFFDGFANGLSALESKRHISSTATIASF